MNMKRLIIAAVVFLFAGVAAAQEDLPILETGKVYTSSIPACHTVQQVTEIVETYGNRGVLAGEKIWGKYHLKMTLRNEPACDYAETQAFQIVRIIEVVGLHFSNDGTSTTVSIVEVNFLAVSDTPYFAIFSNPVVESD